MRPLILLIASLVSVGCQPSESASPPKEAQVAKEASPEPAKPEPTKAAEPSKAPNKEAQESEKKAVDPSASWKREPVKRVPAPADVRKPRKKGTKLTMAGVRYRVLKAGTGKENPTISSQVTIHYTGWTTKGRMFDSTLKTGEPATFGLSGLIDGWKDVIQYMVVGDTFRVWIPEKLAYKGKAGRPAGTLVFDIELLDFK